MKVVHVPFCFHPDPVGGTEVYVEALARKQQEQGCEVLIAAPGDRVQAYCHNGLPVRRFEVMGRATDLRDMYGEGDAGAAESFGRILEEEAPDLVHLHAFTRGASLRLVREAKRRGIAVVFSYHTPTVSCQRGTLLRWGSEVCDGVLDTHLCAQCALHGLGLNKASSLAMGRIPAPVGRLLGNAGLSGGVWTALRMTELVELRHAAFRDLMAEADQVVALCEWVRDLLVRNGVPPEKVALSRQGLCHGHIAMEAPISEEARLRVAFLGRLDPTKGVHILVSALAIVPDAPIQLDIYGVAQGPEGNECRKVLQRAAGGEGRIAFLDPVPAAEVTMRLQHYDVLAVPSQWLETGPMVVLEAFAAGIPVVGSNLGGIAELVEDGANGLLVEAGSPAAWAGALAQLAADRTLVARLRSGVRPPRNIGESAEEMLALYGALHGVPRIAIHA